MSASHLKLFGLVVCLAVAQPAFAFNITVSSRAASFGGAGTVTDVAPGAGDTWQVTDPRITCTTGSTASCVGNATVVGMPVWLRGTPALGSAFASWSGCAATATTLTIDGVPTPGSYCRVATTAAKNVTAYFKPAQYTLTVKPGAAPATGSVQLTGQATPCTNPLGCSYTLPAGSPVTLTATPPAGYELASWAGCSSATNVCSLTLNAALTVTASFRLSSFTVGVTITGDGRVTGGTVDCPGTCTASVARNGNLTLTAAANDGSEFVTWYGCSTQAGPTCELTDVTSNQSVTAAFRLGGCVSCHGKPPSSHGPGLAAQNCGLCHPSTIDTVGEGHHDTLVTLNAGLLATAVPKPDDDYELEITGVARSETQVTSVTFVAKDKAGNPLALGGTGQPSFPSVLLGKRTADGTYRSSYWRAAAGVTYTPPGGVATAPFYESANQDTNAPAGTGNANFSAQAPDGSYTYTFPTLVAPEPPAANTTYGSGAVATGDADDVHTVALYGSRTISGYAFRASTSLDFRPDGVAPATRAVVVEAACNHCHGEIEAHGSRRGLKSCLVCHNPNTVDPETGNSVDMATMVHKIHNGARLASGYAIVGYQAHYYDFGHVVMPPSARLAFEGGGLFTNTNDAGLSRDCSICHDPAIAADAGNAFTNPSVRACGSCHDDADFVTGIGHDSVGPLDDESRCVECHVTGQSLFVPVARSHSPFYEAAFNVNFMNAAVVNPPIPAAGHDFRANLVSVANEGASLRWTFDFSLDGAPLNIKAMATSFRWARCELMLAGPTSDYAAPANGTATGGACTTLATWQATATPGRFTFDGPNWFTAAPAQADGYYTASFEVVLQRVFQSANPANFVRKPFQASPNALTLRNTAGAVTIVTDPVELRIRSRRLLVALEKCNACHQDLGFHSNAGRKGPDYCATCHNAKLDNGNLVRFRPTDTDTGAVGGKLLPESLAFSVFVHRLHMGGRLPSVSGLELLGANGGAAAVDGPWQAFDDAIVYGGNTNPLVANGGLSDFTGLMLPNSMNRCDHCHVSEGALQTWALYEGTGLLPVERTYRICAATTSVLGELWCSTRTPGTLVVTPPLKAACTSCHDSEATDEHADGFTVNPMTAGAQELCVTCHGAGKPLDVLLVHRPVP